MRVFVTSCREGGLKKIPYDMFSDVMYMTENRLCEINKIIVERDGYSLLDIKNMLLIVRCPELVRSDTFLKLLVRVRYLKVCVVIEQNEILPFAVRLQLKGELPRSSS